ncbi:MAG: NAD(P)H-quinone oxidoreductase [Ruminococcaceae bacterium]|nr:NAD(P)H-quinone oxidoreductase [Oscillospiraceae bacterium]
MKAILVNDDHTLRWDNVPDPVPGERDVLIEIHYAALNRADLMQRAGDYPPPPGSPEWMGLEVSGYIRAMGDIAAKESAWNIGDAVCALLGGGGYAEYVTVPYDMLMPVPAGRTLAEAAAMPEAYCTAYLNLFREGQARAGDTLLVHAGASGLASVIIPMAKAFGLRVITTVRRKDAADRIASLGADIVVDTSVTDIRDILREQLALGTPVSIAIDCLGGAEMGACLPYLAHGARWIMIAALAGTLTEIDLKNIYVRNVRIIGSTLRSRTPAFKAKLIAELVRVVWPMVENGQIPAVIHGIYPITKAELAQQIMQDGGHQGKLVLQVR